MDSENIKALIEAFAGIGEGAKEAFIWYVVMEYGGSLLKTIIWVLALVYFFKRLFGMIMAAFHSCRIGRAIGWKGENIMPEKILRDIELAVKEYADKRREENSSYPNR